MNQLYVQSDMYIGISKIERRSRANPSPSESCDYHRVEKNDRLEKKVEKNDRLEKKSWENDLFEEKKNELFV